MSSAVRRQGIGEAIELRIITWEHYIQLQQPELVIDAVRQVVEAVRDPSSWAISITGTPSP